MSRLTESAIEEFAIKLFERLGYSYVYAPDIAHDGENPERSHYGEVLLVGRLAQALKRINPKLSPAMLQDALKEVQRISSPELLANNEAFHRLLTEGVKVSRQQDGNQRGDMAWLIDFDHPENNEFVVANQFTVIENHQNKRPDLVLFVNGIPLVVIELKNATDENATIKSAYQQLETYKQTIPALFTSNALLVISDGLEAKAGSLSAGLSRFMVWKSADGKAEASHLVSQLETLILGMLNKATLLDLLRHFIVFEKSKKEDPQTGVISIGTVKKVAAYHQYYAVNAAVTSTLRAAGVGAQFIAPENQSRRDASRPYGIAQDPAVYQLPGVTQQPKDDKKAGVVWHTQGSGKSLSMVFYTGKIVLALDNPTVLVITDRNDLDDQLFDTFAASKQLLRQEPVQAADRGQLKELLKVASGGVIFSTIQKFQPDEGNVYEQLSDRRNIVVIVDEAHRTQYGFSAKTVDDKDANGEVIGKKVVYGFAKYLRDALPSATYLGFTGTPIEKTIDKALVSEQVIDIFDAAGIKKPDISVLSDEFLAELKGYKHKNVALEVLNKLLNDELKARAKKNLVQSKSLMEMLENAIKKYQNKILTAAEVMEELIKISKEIVASDEEAKHMGLSDFEYAFYAAVANNDSAKSLMQQDKLRALAVVLTQRVRENASIDWTIKESVKAKLKVIVKRTLRQFGYPPDMQLLATETVLKQAEMIANELTGTHKNF